MPNKISPSGIEVVTYPGYVMVISDVTRKIYGDDLDLSSNTSDGQVINIAAEALYTNISQLAISIYNSFTIKYAFGTTLDDRVDDFLGIQRLGGSYTIQDIDITVDRDLKLQGLDGQAYEGNTTSFTVEDSNGNQFILLDTVDLVANTTTALTFRARDIGSISTLTNTINNPVTIILGVTKINNPTVPTTIGRQEETDAQLRIRAIRSRALGAAGSIDSLVTALLAIDGVTDAKVFENYSTITDQYDIPAHSIWVIVDGGSNEKIAYAIYNKKSYGAGMKGNTIYTIVTKSGQLFVARFDRVTAKPLYILFALKPLNPGASVNQDALKKYIIDNLPFGIGQLADSGTLTCLIIAGLAEQGAAYAVLDVQVSKDGLTYHDYLKVDSLEEKWSVAVVGGIPQIIIEILS